MATKQSTIDYIMEQIAQAGDVRYRKMFGEYALYCNEKVVALVCDDQLFLKPTAAGKALIEHLEEAPPYPGAKLYFLISPDLWEDHEFLTNIIVTTAAELPMPKPKKKTHKA
ncbi:MAG TPA: TfoX/Sxy family protein [Candidatus Saccharimonadales bacterium]|nr:TfoX/Sxy family protein [Candidatus Saccharimonadales bacterium]